MTLEELNRVVAVLRPRDGTQRCQTTDVVCSAHGATSLARRNDVTVSLAEAIDLAEGDGLKCDLCGRELVPVGAPITADVVAAIEKTS